MADLLTLTEYKNLAGLPLTDTSGDTQITAMLSAASLAIRNFTDRSFNTTTVTEQRTFEYDGTGYLDIDDATVITEVALSFTLGGDQVLDSTYQWRAMPFGRPVFYYLALSQLGWGLGDGEMGFMYNLDRAVREGLVIAQLPIAKVTGTWGWPAVPEDVKLATLWTVEDWGAGEAGSTTPGVTSESIEGFSRSFGGGREGQMRQLLAVPNRARDILAQYQRVYV
jgi:hypothetical protein